MLGLSAADPFTNDGKFRDPAASEPPPPMLSICGKPASSATTRRNIPSSTRIHRGSFHNTKQMLYLIFNACARLSRRLFPSLGSEREHETIALEYSRVMYPCLVGKYP